MTTIYLLVKVVRLPPDDDLPSKSFLLLGLPHYNNIKMTGVTPEVHSDKRKPREDIPKHRYHR